MVVKENVIDGLINILAERGVLKRDDADALKQEFANHESQNFEDFLLEEGLVEKEDLLQALQEYYGVRAIDVLGEMFDHDLLIMFPKDVLLRNYCLPYYHSTIIWSATASKTQNLCRTTSNFLWEFPCTSI